MVPALYPMKLRSLLVLVCCCAGGTAFAQQTPTPKFSGFSPPDPGQAKTGNLVPNWNFSDPVPLKFYRYDFPYQGAYAKNKEYVSQVEYKGKKCAQLDLPPGVAGNEGGKVETALVPAIGGATYRVEVSAALPKFAAKVHLEVYAEDPRDEITRKDTDAKGPNISIMRIPEGDGHKPLVVIFRGQLDDPKGGGDWEKVVRDITVVPAGIIAGKQVKPVLMAIKAVTFAGTMEGGKSYFTDFKITKVKDPAPGSGTRVIK